MEIVRPGLLTYTFFPLPGEGGPEGTEHLRAVWLGCERLGMTREVPQLEVGMDLPDTPDGPGPFQVLAARGAPDDVAVFQAYAFVHHDAWGIVAYLAPNAETGDESDWDALMLRWAEAVPGPPDPGSQLANAVCRTAVLPSPERDAIVMREEGPEGSRRSFVATAPPRLEETLDRRLWWAGANRLPDLARCLLHAGKIRLESRVFDADIHRIRSEVRSLDAEIDTLVQALDPADGSTVSVEHLTRTETSLVLRESRSTGLMLAVTSLRDLQRTTAIAQTNLAAAIPEEAAGLFGEDLELADHLRGQIEHDLGYAESARERAAEVHRLVRIRLEHATQRSAAQQNKLLLLQTSLLGGLLAGFSSAGVLGADLSIREPLRIPLVVLVVALAAALPLLFAHWQEGWGSLDVAAVAAVGLGLGWTLVQIAWWPREHAAAPTWAALGGAITGMALVTGGAVWIMRRRTAARASGARRTGATGGDHPRRIDL